MFLRKNKIKLKNLSYKKNVVSRFLSGLRRENFLENRKLSFCCQTVRCYFWRENKEMTKIELKWRQVLSRDGIIIKVTHPIGTRLKFLPWVWKLFTSTRDDCFLTWSIVTDVFSCWTNCANFCFFLCFLS